MTTLRFVLTGKAKHVFRLIELAQQRDQKQQDFEQSLKREIHRANSARVVDNTWRRCPEGQGECTSLPGNCEPDKCKATIERMNQNLKRKCHHDPRDTYLIILGLLGCFTFIVLCILCGKNWFIILPILACVLWGLFIFLTLQIAWED